MGLRLAVIGVGILGAAMLKVLQTMHPDAVGYDKYKPEYSGTLEQVLSSDILFMTLPTPYSDINKRFDTSAIDEWCALLANKDYKGCVIIKSTVEPGLTDRIYIAHPLLKVVYSPEFCSVKTAEQDIRDARQIILAYAATEEPDWWPPILQWFQTRFPNSIITICKPVEAELMKLACNCFYAVKIQFFNEIYDVAATCGANYDTVREMMLTNGWINPMHTIVPGTDGLRSYGGQCIPKDTNALLQYMKRNNNIYKVLEATVAERNELRN